MNRYKKEKLLKEIQNDIKALFTNEAMTLEYWEVCLGSSRQETSDKIIYTFSLKDILFLLHTYHWRYQELPKRKFIKLALAEYQNFFFDYNFIFNKPIEVSQNKNI